MVSGCSRGNTVNLGPFLSGQGHGGAIGGTRMSCNKDWVWPPLQRINNNNSENVISSEGTCSCASEISRQQQQQQQQILNINSLMMPVGQSEWHASLPIPSTVYYHTVAPLTGLCSLGHACKPYCSRYKLVNNARPLRFLFGKELTHSDALKKNKIIIPRRDAETHLPYLSSRHGMRLYMEDTETKGIWCFRFKYRVTNKSKVHSLEGTRHFVQVHDLKAGDYIGIYIDEERRRYVIGASKEAEQHIIGESSVNNTNTNTNENNSGCLVSNFGVTNNSNSYIYMDNLSDFSIVDDMEVEARPSTPYPYGNATLTDGQDSCQLERLTPLQTFEFSDLPMDHVSWNT